MFFARNLSLRASPAAGPVADSVAAPTLNERAAAAYLGYAIGDALGATVEFLTPNEISHQYGLHRQICGGGWLHLKPGQVTDDTTMSLALGNAILQCGGRVEALAAAQAFDEWMRGKPVDIGNTVRRNLVRFRRTGQVEAEPCEYDAGNGAAMRVLPVALATLGAEEDEVRAAVRRQAHVTHHNVVSDAGAEMLTLMTQDLLRSRPRGQVLHTRALALVASQPLFAFRDRRCENPSGYVVDTVKAVLQAFFDTNSFEDCLIDVVNRGGDADTTGALAGMLAGAHYGLAAIPARWRKALDADTSSRCLRQAEHLIGLAAVAGLA
jgi:ADP-ribosyl-[dinitrogen reductase] hydrolase